MIAARVCTKTRFFAKHTQTLKLARSADFTGKSHRFNLQDAGKHQAEVASGQRFFTSLNVAILHSQIDPVA
jgi:hypothetical protein